MWCLPASRLRNPKSFGFGESLYGKRCKIAARVTPGDNPSHDARRDGRKQDAIAKVSGCYEISWNAALAQDRQAVGRPRTQTCPVLQPACPLKRWQHSDRPPPQAL